MSHIWMSHVTHVNESNHHVIHIDAALDGRGGHVTHVNESCHTCK